jgi:mannan endo-1,4-beta-mannosidase
VASGYFAGYSASNSSGFSDDSEAEIAQVDSDTGQNPAIVACDYSTGNGEGLDTTCDSYLENWSQHNGGLVSVSVHLPNPVPADYDLGQNGNYGMDTLLPSLTFEDLFAPNSTTAAHEQFDTELTEVADGLIQLANAGVPVLFRPLMEMNGNWFWWGGQTPADFVKMWNYMFTFINNAFVEAKANNNLLWVYSPNDASSGSAAGCATTSSAASTETQPATCDYPGATDVDIVGLDVYTAAPDSITDYQSMLTLGKPFAFTEIGASPNQPATADNPYGEPNPGYDFTLWENAIKTRFPATTYFLSWNSGWGLNNDCPDEGEQLDDFLCAGVGLTNAGFSELMNDPAVIDLGGVDLSNITEPGSVPLLSYTTLGPVALDQFEGTAEAGSTDGWVGWSSPAQSGTGITGGPFAVTEWSARGAYSLKANATLGENQSGALADDLSTPLNLTGLSQITAVARAAPWTSSTAGMTAKLYVEAGPDNTWYDDGAVPVSDGDVGTALSLNLTALPGTAVSDITQIGVDFIPTTGSSGATAIYVDNVRVAGPELLAGFDNSTDGWTGSVWPTESGTGIAGGPWAVTEWSSQTDGYSLKANATLDESQSGILSSSPSTPYDFTDRTQLTAVACVAAWTSSTAGMTAKLYVEAGPDSTWYDDGAVAVTDCTSGTGTTLTLNLAALPNMNDVTQIGVDFIPTTGSSGATAIYVDDVTVQ